jgi:hypothetical protein
MGCCTSKKPEVEVEIVEGCVRNMTSKYTVHYPPHEVRHNTPIYNKTHRQMKGMPCFICGKTEKVETHHFYCEKALQNAYDWEAFGEYAHGARNVQTGDPFDFNWVEVALNPDIFVDSPQNMVALCKEHHTSGNRGIHHVPFPEWIAQKFAKAGFEVLK